MTKPLSRSAKLGSDVMFAAMELLRESGGSMRGADVAARLPQVIEFDDWARELIESNGLQRWHMYLHFFSVDSVKAGFLTKSRGQWALTSAGQAALAKGAESYFRASQQGYREWKRQQDAQAAQFGSQVLVDEDAESTPPEDRFAQLVRDVNTGLAAELLERLRDCDPGFFERLVIQLLLKMGYGGSRQEAGQAVGRSGDGGIDGVIAEDRLGLDSIYIQAKRWQGSVGEPPLRDFLGAMVSRGASKGVFITSGQFTAAAQEFARRSVQHKVVLIDGPRLADLMIQHGLGVSVQAVFELKRVDSDFFVDD